MSVYILALRVCLRDSISFLDTYCTIILKETVFAQPLPPGRSTSRVSYPTKAFAPPTGLPLLPKGLMKLSST